MGNIVSFKKIDNLGNFKRFNNAEEIGRISEDDRLEYEYAYSPDLLPTAQQSNDGMWRYLPLLPISGPILYPLAVGGTPLVAPHHLRKQVGLPKLWLKDETRSPTGSNKDRATALILEHALHNNIQTVSCASTGNVAVSLAVGAAACGIEAVIFVPSSVLDMKLQVMQMAKARIFKVKEGYEAAIRLSRVAAQTFGWYDRNTGYNPFTVEAKKTVAFEIWEQLERKVPDVVIVPVGDGVTLNGIAKGFRELMLCGAITQTPRIIGVQAEKCQPLKQAWEGNYSPLENASTIADGIAVTSPINAALTLRDVRESGGYFVAVSDESMLEAIALLASTSGILAEPAGAVALAGASAALEQGLLKPNDTVIALVTGSGLKTPQYLRSQKILPVHEVSSDVNELKRILDRSL